LVAFVNKLNCAQAAYDGANRRKKSRQAWVVRASAIPLDEGFQPVGEAFLAISRDISDFGLALYHTQPVASPYLALRLIEPSSASALRTTMRIVRCRKRGRFYEIAGSLLYSLFLHSDQNAG
jgi:hypothetical protein